jgi:hypothetical protein|uniref:Photosystem I assembly protein Ycf4 n=1 Tax=Raphidocelis subcapitata TaxID=307507 RepID=A0A2Z6FBQ5_9CHLO|nr:photosystem I assembly protein Ycf4 [Raphidocelis subcapitata]
MNTNNLIRRYLIIGERRFSNYWWATIVFVGALGFLLAGIGSYLNTLVQSEDSSNINPIFFFVFKKFLLTEPATNTSSSSAISFFPQGLLMCFYGSLGLLLSFYWWFLIFWNVGGGFNEFNKQDGFVRIFRWGYPGQNRKIDLYYNFKDIESIRVEIKQAGFNDSQRTIYLRLKNRKEIPLTGIGEPLTIQEIEKQASELANFLQVALEGL